MKKISETDCIIDVPYSNETAAQTNTYDYSNHTTSVDKHTADYLEQQADYADRMDKHVYKKHGLKLMIGCGIAYIVIVLIDTVTINLGGQTSSLADGLIELLKFVISTLIGFVFSENVKKDK